MNRNGLDKRFCQEALDALKSFRHTQFTVRFLNKHGLSTSKKLSEMWADIEKWLRQGDDSRCLDLLEYVDNLKMWGKQRIFLFEINGNQRELINQLSDPDEDRKLVGDLYDNPVYHWNAPKPFLAHVKHTTDPDTGALLLVFKLIEMHDYKLMIDGTAQTYEERSTNFFIINLRDGYAELRIQRLPVNANKKLKEERELLEAELRKYLDFDRFEPIPLEPIMVEMLRKPIYTIDRIILKSGKKIIHKVSIIDRIVGGLFRNPTPSHIAAHWECDQGLLGTSRSLYFSLYGSSGSIAFNGIADPRRVQDILEKIVDIHRAPPVESIWKRGCVDNKYQSFKGRPTAQAAFLVAGAIAAYMIWIVIKRGVNYVLEEWLERTIPGGLLVAITILVDFFWIWFYYGSNRIKQSFAALWNMSWPERRKMIVKAKKDNKIKHGIDNEELDEVSHVTYPVEPEDED